MKKKFSNEGLLATSYGSMGKGVPIYIYGIIQVTRVGFEILHATNAEDNQRTIIIRNTFITTGTLLKI